MSSQRRCVRVLLLALQSSHQSRASPFPRPPAPTLTSHLTRKLFLFFLPCPHSPPSLALLFAPSSASAGPAAHCFLALSSKQVLASPPPPALPPAPTLFIFLTPAEFCTRCCCQLRTLPAPLPLPPPPRTLHLSPFPSQLQFRLPLLNCNSKLGFPLLFHASLLLPTGHVQWCATAAHSLAYPPALQCAADNLVLLHLQFPAL